MIVLTPRSNAYRIDNYYVLSEMQPGAGFCGSAILFALRVSAGGGWRAAGDRRRSGSGAVRSSFAPPRYADRGEAAVYERTDRPACVTGSRDVGFAIPDPRACRHCIAGDGPDRVSADRRVIVRYAPFAGEAGAAAITDGATTRLGLTDEPVFSMPTKDLNQKAGVDPPTVTDETTESLREP